MEDDVLILGNGYFGTRIHEALGFPVSGRRINSIADAEAELIKYKPKTIINCIGFVGRNVDDCEIDKDKTLFLNTFIPIMLGEVCWRNNIKLVHISTGCVYHYDYAEDLPIDEDRPPDFFDLYYSRTKIYAERALEFLAKKCSILILRPRVPLDDRPNPKNLLTKLIATKKAINLPNSSTYLPDFIRALGHLLEIGAKGTYNVVNKNPLYYPDLLETYKKYVPDFAYEVIDFKKLNMVRTNLVLSVKKLEDAGFKAREIKDVLEECVKSYLEYSSPVAQAS